MNRILGVVVSIAVLFMLLYLRLLVRFTDDISRGNALTEKGEFNSAFFAYGNAIQRSPNNPLAALFYGLFAREAAPIAHL